MPRTSRVAIVAAVGLLALAGCTDGDPDITETPTPSPTSPSPSPITPTTAAPTSPSPTASPTATSPTTEDPTTAPAALPSLAGPCSPAVPDGVAVETISVAFPEGWRVTDGCEFFDPEADTLPQETEADVAVSWRVADTDYATAADVGEEIADPIRYVGARGGYQTVRIEGVATGTGLRQEGEPVALWLVDLSAGTDDDGGVLIGSARETGDTPFSLARQALDRMADTVIIDPPAVGSDAPVVVTRQEGGGLPFTVTYDGECFVLHAGGPDGEEQDRDCEVGAPGDSEVATTLLGDGDLPVLAGLAPPLADRVTVPAASGLFGAVATPLEGAAAFAMHVRQPPFEITVTDAAGDTIVTSEVAG